MMLIILHFEAFPTLDEVKQVVFSMNSSSAPGPDGLSGKFFHHCWQIISQDLYNVIMDFVFQGMSFPSVLLTRVLFEFLKLIVFSILLILGLSI